MTTTEAPVVMIPVDEPDPLWEIDYHGKKMKAKHRDLFLAGRSTIEENACNAMADRAVRVSPDYHGPHDTTYHCTRGVHPEHWRHIATSGYRGDQEVLSYWGGTDPKDLATEPVEADPEPEPFVLQIGQLYKFKNRPTVLMFVGRRKGQKVEVLDLTHQRYRVLDEEQLIPRRTDAEPPTTEQMMWVATFMAEGREKVRTTALEQRSAGYFKSKQDLDKVLGELHLEPTIVVFGGTISVTLDVTAWGVKGTTAVRMAIEEWLKQNPMTMPPTLKVTGTPIVKTNLSERSG